MEEERKPTDSIIKRKWTKRKRAKKTQNNFGKKS